MPKPIQRVRKRQTFSQASQTDSSDGSRAGVRYCDRREGSQVFTSKCKSCVKQHLRHVQHLRWRAAPMYASSRRSCWKTSASSLISSLKGSGNGDRDHVSISDTSELKEIPRALSRLSRAPWAVWRINHSSLALEHECCKLNGINTEPKCCSSMSKVSKFRPYVWFDSSWFQRGRTKSMICEAAQS